MNQKLSESLKPSPNTAAALKEDPEIKFIAHLSNQLPKTKDEVKQRVQEVAQIFDMSPEDFRMHCFNRIYKDEIGPGYLIERGYARKLNIIFDVDHTLVFSIDANMCPQVVRDSTHPKIQICMKNFPQFQVSIGNGFVNMVIVVRDGVREMLEFLSEFCNFFVYSHGMREYIMKILEVIDPDERYFKDRERTVLAPKDHMEQQQFVINKKSVFDFRSSITKLPIFENEDCFIIDDQFQAIKEKEYLLQSKKFLKLVDTLDSKKQKDFVVYQYPDTANKLVSIDLAKENTRTHFVKSFITQPLLLQDLNRKDELNQLYFLSVLITKLYLNQFTLYPEKKIIELLKEYKKSIFAGAKFYFGEFQASVATQQEKETAMILQNVCEQLVKELGGQMTLGKAVANYSLYFKQSDLKTISSPQLKCKEVNFRMVTDSFFLLARMEDEPYAITQQQPKQ